MEKNLPAMLETWVQSLGWEDPLEKRIATHSSILARRIPQTDGPGRLQSMRTKSVQLRPSLCNPMDCSPLDSSVHGDSPGKNTRVGCHFWLQWILLTQGSNPHLMSPALAGRFFSTSTTWGALVVTKLFKTYSLSSSVYVRNFILILQTMKKHQGFLRKTLTKFILWLFFSLCKKYEPCHQQVRPMYPPPFLRLRLLPLSLKSSLWARLWSYLFSYPETINILNFVLIIPFLSLVWMYP